MPQIDKADVKLGFWIAAGFFLFGLVLALLQWGWTRVRKGI
jgi:hypothetical protein